MKDFLRKYGIYFSLPVIVVVAFYIASVFHLHHFSAVLIGFYFVFLPLLSLRILLCKVDLPVEKPLNF